MCNEIVGVNGDEGTPVPIPNTVVKLVYGDNTWLATAREDNSTPTSFQTDPKGSVLLFLGGRKIPNGSFRMIRVCEVKTQTVGKMIVFRQSLNAGVCCHHFFLAFFHSSQYNAIIGLRARQADGIPLWKLYRHILSLKAPFHRAAGSHHP